MLPFRRTISQTSLYWLLRSSVQKARDLVKFSCYRGGDVSWRTTTKMLIFRMDDLSSQHKGSGPRRSRLTPVVGMPKGEEGRFLLAGERGILGRCLSMPLSDLWIADTLLGPTRKHGL